MDRLVGRSLGPYELGEVVGRGGMGIVYSAVHRALQQPRAIKLLPPQLAHDENFVERFLREAKTAAGLRHPNIVLIHSVEEQDGVHYIVMDLVEGRSLREVIRREGPLDLARAASLLGQLAAALDYAHARGVTHRDVKPGNVVVGPADHVTLLDFGIARAAAESHLTKTGAMVGTPEYMAPEGVTGAGDNDTADRYALGVVAFEMLTGRLPFSGTDSMATMYAHIHTPPPAPRSIRPDLPVAAERVLLRQLAKDPAERFPSAADFAAALAAAARSERPTPVAPDPQRDGDEEQTMPVVSGAAHTAPRPPLPADDPPTIGAVERPPKRGGRGPAFALVALAAVVLAGLGALLVNQAPEPIQPTPVAKLATPVTPPPTSPPAPTATAEAPPPTVVTPEQRLQAAQASLSAGDFPAALAALQELRQASPSTPGVEDTLFRAHLDFGRALLDREDLDGSLAQYAEALTLRPDDATAREGQRQATLAKRYAEMEAARGRDDEAAIAALEAIIQVDPGFRDSRQKLYELLVPKVDRLAAAGKRGEAFQVAQRAIELDPARPEARERLALFGVSAASAEHVRELARLGRGTVVELAYSPDGRAVAVASSMGVYLYDAATLAELRYLETGSFVWDVAFSPDGQTLASAADDKTVQLWRVGDGALLRTLTGHGAAVRSVAFAPDGATLASGSEDATVRLWRTSDGGQIRSLEGHTGKVFGVAIAADGQTLASGSLDGTARLWRLGDGGLLRTLQGHAGSVANVAISRDGRTLATGSYDRTVRLWRVSDGAPLRTL
jgi:serine/threonine protein kinase/tetratricopeptide (TPR) repeat protein